MAKTYYLHRSPRPQTYYLCLEPVTLYMGLKPVPRHQLPDTYTYPYLYPYTYPYTNTYFVNLPKQIGTDWECVINNNTPVSMTFMG